jgi:hypothetical protein
LVPAGNRRLGTGRLDSGLAHSLRKIADPGGGVAASG